MTTRKLKILHTVENYFPTICGMQEVVQRISEGLVKQGHEVWVATSLVRGRPEVINGVRIAEFDISGNEVVGYTFGDVEKYRQFLLNSRFDIVTNFAGQHWATDFALPLLGKISGKKVFVPTGFSGLYVPEFKNYFEKMKSYLFSYDASVFLSDDYRDINFAREVGYDKAVLIPNGASQEEFNGTDTSDIRSKYKIPSDSFLVLTVGSHTGHKGHKEAIEIFDRANIKNSTFIIVANGNEGGCAGLCSRLSIIFPFFGYIELAGGVKGFVRSFFSKIKTGGFLRNMFQRKRLLVRNISRKDTVQLFKAADVFLFPSNIECSPIVLFEALAGKTPFLATNVGNVREIVKWTGGGKVLPTMMRSNLCFAEVVESARVLKELSTDRKARDQMAEAGHKAWNAKFTWERIVSQYEDLYQRLASS